MSEPKKNVCGRGRGAPSNRGRGTPTPRGRGMEGPWQRAEKLKEESVDLTKQNKQKEEFVLSKTNFPPLPTPSGSESKEDTNQNTNDEQEIVLPSEEKDKKKYSIVTGATVDEQYANSEDENKDNINVDQSLKEGNDDNNSSTQSIVNVELSAKEKFSEIESSVRGSFKLSPVAKEFIPKSLNPSAEDFIPSALTWNKVLERSNEEKKEHNEEEKSRALPKPISELLVDVEDTLQFCNTKLKETPGDFDILMGIVDNHLLMCEGNSELTLNILDNLFQMVLKDPLFAYHAVKLLCHLINILEKRESNQLRDELMRKAQKQFKETIESRLTNAELSGMIYPSLMFLSELYLQLLVGGMRLAFVGRAVLQVLQKYLQVQHIPVKERLMTINNILKLTGIYLEEDEPQLLSAFFEELENKLNSERANIDVETFKIIYSLIDKQKNSWNVSESEGSDVTGAAQKLDEGREVPAPNICMEPPDQYKSVVSECGVFYGPDGHVMGLEEELFCLTSLHEENSNSSSPLLPSSSPSSMDGEMQAAYEEFLLTIPPSHYNEVTTYTQQLPSNLPYSHINLPYMDISNQPMSGTLNYVLPTNVVPVYSPRPGLLATHDIQGPSTSFYTMTELDVGPLSPRRVLLPTPGVPVSEMTELDIGPLSPRRVLLPTPGVPASEMTDFNIGPASPRRVLLPTPGVPASEMPLLDPPECQPPIHQELPSTEDSVTSTTLFTKPGTESKDQP